MGSWGKEISHVRYSRRELLTFVWKCDSFKTSFTRGRYTLRIADVTEIEAENRQGRLTQIGGLGQMYQLEIKNVGRQPEPVTVFVLGERKLAMFHDRRDAETARRVVEMLRSDSALEWVRVI